MAIPPDMQTISVKDVEHDVIALKLTMALQGLDTRLISVMIDVSGSSVGKNQLEILNAICDSISITGQETIINLLQFDDRLRGMYSCVRDDFCSVLKDYKLSGGGGGNFDKALNLIHGTEIYRSSYAMDTFAFCGPEKLGRNKIVPRAGDLAKTPIILLSDGIDYDFDENEKEYALEPIILVLC